MFSITGRSGGHRVAAVSNHPSALGGPPVREERNVKPPQPPRLVRSRTDPGGTAWEDMRCSSMPRTGAADARG